jgi:hypothetical protein
MDIHFCKYYTGDGYPPSNRYCRICPESKEACDDLWQKVVDLANSQKGNPVSLPKTRALLFPNPNNPDLVHLKINCQWNLSKEDFLHFISTGRAQMGRKEQRHDPGVSPSMTRQEPYVQSIMEALGGQEIEEIKKVKRIQGKMR